MVVCSGSYAVESEKPPKRSSSAPAASTAANSIRVAKPSAAPISTCSSTAPITETVSRAGGCCRTTGNTASPNPTLTTTFTACGTPPVAIGGATTDQARIRVLASRSATRDTASKETCTAPSAQQLRDRVVQVLGEADQGRHHPVAADQQREPDRDGLRHERERELLDLRRRLEQRDGEADDQRGHEHRRGQLGRDEQRLDGDVDDRGVVHGPIPVW